MIRQWVVRNVLHRLKWKTIVNVSTNTIIVQARCSCYDWQRLRQVDGKSQTAAEQWMLTEYEYHLDAVGG